MKSNDFQISFLVDATPGEAFNGINNIAGWWTDNFSGSTAKPNDEFTVRFYDDLHVSTQKVVELIPDKKIVWLVTGSNLKFLEDKNEWNNTRIVFELSKAGDKTKIDFTHIGLVPEVECYNDCTPAWGQYLRGSLAELINTGVGKPTRKTDKLPA